MATGGGGERESLGRFVQRQTKYGTTTKQMSKTSSFIKHPIKQSDTLVGIALKYGVSVEQVKRENKLWSSDQLFLREYLFIPRTQDNSQLDIPEDCIVTGTEMSLTQKAHESHSREERSDSVKSNTSITSDGVTISSDVSAKDFLSKYDIDIAKLKSNVKKMEQNARFLECDLDNPLSLLPRRSLPAISSSSKGFYFSEGSSPVLVIRNRTNSKDVKSCMNRSELANDELFQL